MSETHPPLRTAEIIAVGSELLGSTRLDTNSLFLAERLWGLGIELRAKAVVGDRRGLIETMFRQALDRVDLVILTGGLGPTEDDLTRDAVATVLELPMHEDPAIVDWIAQRFARRGLQMPENNRRQAMVPRGATVLENRNGSAPGLMIETAGRLVVLLPGPPRELQPMMDALVSGALGRRAGRERLFRRSMFVIGQSESHVDSALQERYAAWQAGRPSIDTTILAAPGQIELHLTARADDETAAASVLDAACGDILAILGKDVFSTDGRPLERVVGDLLRERELTISAAESCTGGLLLSRLTDVPGSSAYVLGGAVTYSNELKTLLALVPPSLIAEHGAVSEPVAAALAGGIRKQTGSSIGVGITGIAGPSGGTPAKPVGTVAIAVVRPDGILRVRSLLITGSGRQQIRFNATQAALDMVRRALIG
jgi:nicotinamide-nucleotide amidase